MRRLVLVVLVLMSGMALSEGIVPCGVLPASPSCYAVLEPGRVLDALTAVELDAPVSASTGQLLVTTVQVDTDLGVGEWLRARRDPRRDDVPREQYVPDDADPEVAREQFAVMMEQSQQSSALAALGHLGYALDPRGAQVEEVIEDTPATGLLGEGDVLLAVDGAQVTDADTLVDVVRTHAPGEQVVLAVRGPGTGERDVEITLAENPDLAGSAFLGVLVTTAVELPLAVDIDAEGIGGPSAGLMFALGIVDLLSDEDLTGGQVVAGTGTITADGRVGAIGGIRQKVVGATQRGDAAPATVFLVPRDNLAEARSAAVDVAVTLVPVRTLDDAVDALAAVRRGSPPTDAVALAPVG